MNIKDYHRIAIVGRGAVGSTVADQLDQIHVDYDQYHSGNIETIFHKSYDLVIYAGVRATKYLAEADPEADKKHCELALEQLKKIDARELVLISTIDALDAEYKLRQLTTDISAYGLNRYILEYEATKYFESDNITRFTILQLPALYGSNVKKNQWYNIMIGPENLILNDNSLKTLEDIRQEYQIDRHAMHSILEEDLEVNLLSTINGKSIFAWFNLDDILVALEAALNSNKRKCLVISKSDDYEYGMFIAHSSMLRKFNQHVYCPFNIQMINHMSAVHLASDQNSSLIIKTGKDIFDPSWKEKFTK